MANADAVDPVASLVGTQMNGIQIKSVNSLLLGLGLQLRIVVVNAKVRDFYTRSSIVMSAEDYANTCLPSYSGRDGEKTDESQNGPIDACAMDFPVFIERESTRSLMSQLDDEVVSSFRLKCAGTDADNQVLLIAFRAGA